MRHETIKILKGNTGSNLFDIDHSNSLLNMSPEARETKAKINYWDFIKMKSFCTINKSKMQPIEQDKIFVNNKTDKWLVSKIYKELTKLNTQKPNNPIKNGQKT